MADKIRVGIIGLGRISTLHLPAYKPEHNMDAELVAVCDTNKKRVKEVAEEYNVEKAYYDVDDLLRDPEIDAVEILTPHDTHCDITVKAANAGKHISLQKVPAMTISEMDKMIDATKKNNVYFRVFENNRYHPPYVKAMELIQSGVIGKVETVDYRMWCGEKTLGAWDVPLKAWMWRISEKANYKSPIIFDDGYHKHSIIAKFFQPEQFDSVMAWLGHKIIKGVVKLDNPSVMMYICKNSSHYGVWNSSYHKFVPMQSDYYGDDEYCEITGEHGTIIVPGGTGRFFENTPEYGPARPGVHWIGKDGVWHSDTSLETDWAASFLRCSSAFIDGVKTGKQCDLSGEESRYILQITLGFIRSIRNNYQMVKLKDITDKP
jgi:predicted dehydrogenase